MGEDFLCCSLVSFDVRNLQRLCITNHYHLNSDSFFGTLNTVLGFLPQINRHVPIRNVYRVLISAGWVVLFKFGSSRRHCVTVTDQFISTTTCSPINLSRFIFIIVIILVGQFARSVPESAFAAI